MVTLTGGQRAFLECFCAIQADIERAPVVVHVPVAAPAVRAPAREPKQKLMKVERRTSPRPKRSVDEAWFERNVAVVRQLAGDVEHQQRYLSGVECAHGLEMRQRMEAAAT